MIKKIFFKFLLLLVIVFFNIYYCFATNKNGNYSNFGSETCVVQEGKEIKKSFVLKNDGNIYQLVSQDSYKNESSPKKTQIKVLHLKPRSLKEGKDRNNVETEKQTMVLHLKPMNNKGKSRNPKDSREILKKRIEYYDNRYKEKYDNLHFPRGNNSNFFENNNELNNNEIINNNGGTSIVLLKKNNKNGYLSLKDPDNVANNDQVNTCTVLSEKNHKIKYLSLKKPDETLNNDKIDIATTNISEENLEEEIQDEILKDELAEEDFLNNPAKMERFISNSKSKIKTLYNNECYLPIIRAKLCKYVKYSSSYEFSRERCKIFFDIFIKSNLFKELKQKNFKEKALLNIFYIFYYSIGTLDEFTKIIKKEKEKLLLNNDPKKIDDSLNKAEKKKKELENEKDQLYSKKKQMIKE